MTSRLFSNRQKYYILHSVQTQCTIAEKKNSQYCQCQYFFFFRFSNFDIASIIILCYLLYIFCYHKSLVEIPTVYVAFVHRELFTNTDFANVFASIVSTEISQTKLGACQYSFGIRSKIIAEKLNTIQTSQKIFDLRFVQFSFEFTTTASRFLPLWESPSENSLKTKTTEAFDRGASRLNRNFRVS